VGLGTLTGLGRWTRRQLGVAETPQKPNTFGRDDVAKKVINLAGVGITLTAVVIIAGPIVASWLTGSAIDSKQLHDVSMTMFNTLVPMFGTWVGTVIAFYFARENYEAAAKATKDLVGQLGDDRLKQIRVQDAWTAVDNIKGVTVEIDQESKVDFKKDVEDILDQGEVSRVPVWTAGKVVRYVIHQSMIYRYLAKNKTGKSTLADFLNFSTDKKMKMRDIVSKIGWVAETATLADAKAKMEGTPDCQDVFVTHSGSDKEAVLGWITNVDIAKKAKA
jgi:hypothetical protein